MEEEVSRLKIDKLTEIYSIKVPEVLKVRLDHLSPQQKKELNNRILVKMAEAVHNATFDPSIYLSSD